MANIDLVAAAIDTDVLDPEDPTAFTIITEPTGQRSIHTGQQPCPDRGNPDRTGHTLTPITPAQALTEAQVPGTLVAQCATEFGLDDDSEYVLGWCQSARKALATINDRTDDHEYLETLGHLHSYASAGILDQARHPGVAKHSRRTAADLLTTIAEQHATPRYEALLTARIVGDWAVWRTHALRQNPGEAYRPAIVNGTWYGATLTDLGWDTLDPADPGARDAWLAPQVWVSAASNRFTVPRAFSTAFDPATYDGRDGKLLYRIPVAIAIVHRVPVDVAVVTDCGENWTPHDAATIRSLAGRGDPRRAHAILTAMRASTTT